MTITIQHGDIVKGEADTLIVQCDGASRKSMGRVGLLMQRQMGEEEWDDVMDQFTWPIPIGTAQHRKVNVENYRSVILMACMSHQEEAHLQFLASALNRAMAAAAGQGCTTVAMVLGQGGYRLTTKDAARAIQNAARSQPSLRVTVFTLDHERAVIAQQLINQQ